jgi:hypothetical protein
VGDVNERQFLTVTPGLPLTGATQQSRGAATAAVLTVASAKIAMTAITYSNLGC